MLTKLDKENKINSCGRNRAMSPEITNVKR